MRRVRLRAARSPDLGNIRSPTLSSTVSTTDSTIEITSQSTGSGSHDGENLRPAARPWTRFPVVKGRAGAALAHEASAVQASVTVSVLRAADGVRASAD